MEKLHFLVQGSSDEPYEVIFVKENNELRASCSCAAGEMGVPCKHRMNLLQGIDKACVNGADQINLLVTWFPGTQLEQALDDLKAEELELEKAKKKLASRKKKVGMCLNSGKYSP